MTAFISALAFLTAAIGLVLVAVFLLRMVAPIQRLITAYCESKAVNAFPGMVKAIVSAWSEATDAQSLSSETGPAANNALLPADERTAE